MPRPLARRKTTTTDMVGDMVGDMVEDMVEDMVGDMVEAGLSLRAKFN